MSIFSNTNIVAGASGKQRGYTIEESLRFNASQSSYLSWTPASAGNRKTWTWSGWVKRGALGVERSIFSVGATGANFALFFHTSDQLRVWTNGGNASIYTNAVYRDPSAWYHIVLQSSNVSPYIKLYVNGEEITSFFYDNRATYPSTNNTEVNSVDVHRIGGWYNGGIQTFDGYLTEVNFIDGSTPATTTRVVNGVTQTILTEFGEFDSVTGVWKPAEYTGAYGTNGFYLPMQLDNTVEGFNTVTWAGNSGTQQIRGVGFSPDLVWIKVRNEVNSHYLFDTIRGADKALFTDSTSSETDYTATGRMTSFDNDGFSVKYSSSTGTNASGDSYVAWCWDAGSSTVSNTDGSITSSVRANPAYGFSVVTYAGSQPSTFTIGHGLGVTPNFIITKARNTTSNWGVYYRNNGVNTNWMTLNTTDSQGLNNGPLSGGAYVVFDSSTIEIASSSFANAGSSMVAYCFSEVAGYSKFGSYTGTGASGNAVTTGFRPAFVTIKRTDSVDNWRTYDSTRDIEGAVLYPNLSAVEDAAGHLEFTDTGWTWLGSNSNASGGTYIYMAFKDTREYAYWLDDSGNNNDWQPNGGITTNSTVTDTPTPYEDGGNYAVINPLDATITDGSITNGNLTLNGTSNWNTCRGNWGMSSGKWYWETTHSVYNQSLCGIADSVWPTSTYYPGYSSTGYAASYGQNAVKYVDGGNSAYGATFTIGDVIGYALDMDAGTLTCYKNGVSQGEMVSGLTAYGTIFPAIAAANGAVINANFGQRPFAYTPPTGFKPLHTGNLPDSAIVDGSEYFNAVLYTGNGYPTSGTQSISTVNFQPDFVWIKDRSRGGYNHFLQDVLRGSTNVLRSNTTGAANTESTAVTSFNADGFSLGASNEVNYQNDAFISWNWKANGAGVSNTDGSITSTVSANPTAGFSIVTWTGVGSAPNTIGHGLGAAPKMIITKTRTASIAYNWNTYHDGLDATAPEDYFVALNTTAARGPYTTADLWNRTKPTSSVFSVNSNAAAGPSGDLMVAYCFADVEGYSKFGKYTGNGSTDGPFVYTGFRPAWVMWKRTDAVTDGWYITDTTRSLYNQTYNALRANSANAESGEAVADFLSNGFKIRIGANGNFNASGGTYIYMAFAENPFKNSLAR